jgi:hypothetical protein
MAVGHAEAAIGQQNGGGWIAADVACHIADFGPRFAQVIATPQLNIVFRFAAPQRREQGTASRAHAAGHDRETALRWFVADVALEFPRQPAVGGASAEDAAFFVVRLLAATAKHEALAWPQWDQIGACGNALNSLDIELKRPLPGLTAILCRVEP